MNVGSVSFRSGVKILFSPGTISFLEDSPRGAVVSGGVSTSAPPQHPPPSNPSDTLHPPTPGPLRSELQTRFPDTSTYLDVTIFTVFSYPFIYYLSDAYSRNTLTPWGIRIVQLY